MTSATVCDIGVKPLWRLVTDRTCEAAPALQSPMPDSCKTREAGWKSTTGKDNAHMSLESRSSRMS